MTTRGRAGRLVCCVRAKNDESGGSNGRFTKRMDGVGEAYPAGARRSCNLLPEVGGREYDLVDRMYWEAPTRC